MPDRRGPVTPDPRVTGQDREATEIRRWQALTGQWTDSRFDNDDLRQRGLVLAEETGEVCRCIVKAEQGIRGGSEKWLADLPGEVADVFFCLAAIAHRAGFDLADAIAAKWAELDARTYESMRAAPPIPESTYPSEVIERGRRVADGN